ncbi:hypothetical protein [Spirillospora sp. NBC_01491]|uniref:hypothetical protein n=1 Tax=Spirillospora sp. NBC_01491 TaxID=2976007 RepID=UPI002E35E4E4|nr:hypothetical protein [Spirillospora sp. NBC_01491]
MGTDVFALITRWEPMVDAFRSSGSLDFYWNALPKLLPYAWQHRISGGYGFVEAAWYYDALREHLPVHVRTPADAFVRMLYARLLFAEASSDDLKADSGGQGDECVLYALRPSSVRSALERFDSVPWDALSEIGARTVDPPRTGDRYVPDFDAFETVLYQHCRWLRDAAARDHGVVAIISQ